MNYPGLEKFLVGARIFLQMCSYEHLPQCRSLPRRFRTCWTNSKRQSKAGYAPWNALQRLRLVLSEVGNVAIPAPTQKTFEAEGEILEHALTKSLHLRNEAIKSLCSSVRRLRDAADNSVLGLENRFQMGFRRYPPRIHTEGAPDCAVPRRFCNGQR